MNSRSYLSIGDVLTLLRQEFPDVTISKIRFLESQGLVNPERTPSGYRKFYEHDVERLRWVLRQQREHFLPLKVIKDRLDDDLEGQSAGPEPSRATRTAGAAAPADGRRDTEPDERAVRPVLVGQRAAAAEGGPGSTLPGIDPAPGGPGAVRPVAFGGSERASTGSTASAPGAGTMTPPPAAGGGDSEGPSGGVPVGSAARRARPGEAEAGRRAKAPSTSSEPGPPPDDDGAGGNGLPDSPRPTAKAPKRAASRGDGSAMSVDELAAACGLEVAVVRELEEFGLVTSSNVAGVESFGEDALAVARLAAQFARFGVEPRHLRLYKNAAEREAGFVEQIVLPLVRQRNPDARARAREAADELALLGQQLRSSLLRGALGNLLEG